MTRICILYSPTEPPTACCQGAFIEETNLFWGLHLLSLFQLVRVTRKNENVIFILQTQHQVQTYKSYKRAQQSCPNHTVGGMRKNLAFLRVQKLWCRSALMLMYSTGGSSSSSLLLRRSLVCNGTCTTRAPIVLDVSTGVTLTNPMSCHSLPWSVAP